MAWHPTGDKTWTSDDQELQGDMASLGLRELKEIPDFKHPCFGRIDHDTG